MNGGMDRQLALRIKAVGTTSQLPLFEVSRTQKFMVLMFDVQSNFMVSRIPSICRLVVVRRTLQR